MTMNGKQFLENFLGNTSLSEEQTIALINAVRDVNLKLVKVLLADGADANKFVWQIIIGVMSPLTAAIKLLHPNSHYPSDNMMEIFDVLLDSVADVNKPCPRTYRTPIMYAAAVRNVRCVKKLINKGAALHTADKFGDTVWTLAAKSGSVDLLKCLIEDHGIDKNCN